MRDLAEYYLPPFEACVRDAGLGSVMCSYNALNGVPTCADDWLQNTLLRDHWKWNEPEQYIVSDCFAIDQILVSHNYSDTAEEAAQAALQAGTDLDCGVFYQNFLPGALDQGLVSEAEVDVALKRIYSSLIKVGYFDPTNSHPYQEIAWEDFNTPEARKLARKAATSGMVLLKHDHSTLPLTVPTKRDLRVLLVGEWANATIAMLGGYSGVSPYIHSPLYGLQQVENVLVDSITSLDDPTSAATVAQAHDVIVYVGGIDQSVERETLDRTSLSCNTTQLALISAVSSVGKPTIIVQSGGGQLDDSEFLSNPNISAILWVGYPGQDGGVAIADVLFGNVAPAGRLPVTMYPATYVSLPMTDMGLRPDGEKHLGRTYKWHDGAVLPFGHGLHYTTFEVDASFVPVGSLHISEILHSCENGERPEQAIIGHVHLRVHNIGNTTSDYVALAFLRGDGGPPPWPIKELVGYERLHDLEPGCSGEAGTVVLPITVASLSRWDEEGRRILYPGRYTVAIDTEPELAGVSFEVLGEERVVEVWPERPGRG
ncbi:putative exo-1,4-beta-xylosidase [Fulvia fulva]|uniref:xylan 1,4-beta-xylosidase n=1 Tax=Passalora fulva TaxID=5499 RepID=A0A9Q8USA9_PASFU|nr:putative exo-1,4-beta-xylosidase [Fulvia fulva]KAK4619288.1 putative exo-1,4-beta-xylosidase [Fulvia fulva]UJO20603.1 putative exo-1,4-beta-xylosidase [Fulvia fulva]